MREMKPLITVAIIIPIYNAEQYILSTLQSVVQQSYRDVELILVDDCSKDNGLQVAEEFLITKSFLNYKIIHLQKNSGPSYARNRGVLDTNADYVFFLDSDDVLTDSCIEILVQQTYKYRYDFVTANYCTDTGDNGLLYTNSVEAYDDEIVRLHSKGMLTVMPWNKLCKRDFLIENNLFFDEDLRVHEDFVWTYKLACKATSVFINPDVTYIYKVRPQSLITSLTIEKDIEWYIKAFEHMMSYVARENRFNNTVDYIIIEGKKCGIEYSLLQRGEIALYKRTYHSFRRLAFINPLLAYNKGIIGIKYLLRDLHYIFPQKLGLLYKRFFYLLVYKWRGKKIEGAVWG